MTLAANHFANSSYHVLAAEYTPQRPPRPYLNCRFHSCSGANTAKQPLLCRKLGGHRHRIVALNLNTQGQGVGMETRETRGGWALYFHVNGHLSVRCKAVLRV